MKLCIFTNHFFPEDFKVNDIAFELVNRGIDVTVITAIPDYPKGKFFEGYSLFKRRREEIRGVKVIRLPIIPRGGGGAFRLILNYLSYFICASIFTFFHSFRNKYDAAFVHLTSPFFIGLPAVHLKKRQRIPLYFWTLDLWPESLISAGGISHPVIIKPQDKMVSYVYKNCDKILIGSKGFAKSICKKGDFESKLAYFPNWAESVATSQSEDISNSIPPFNSMSQDDLIFLFAGNLGEAQNLDTILFAANQLKKKKNIKFVFIGDGRRRENLLALMEELSLQETVFFPGRFPLETMPFFMRKSSVLMVSLKDEPCFNLTVPAKVQFYMSQGKPVLAMLNGDGQDLIREAQCGLAVNADDVDGFVQAIEKIANSSKDNLSTWGENGKKFYDNNFTKEQRINQLMELMMRSFPPPQVSSSSHSYQPPAEQHKPLQAKN